VLPLLSNEGLDLDLSRRPADAEVASLWRCKFAAAWFPVGRSTRLSSLGGCVVGAFVSHSLEALSVELGESGASFGWLVEVRDCPDECEAAVLVPVAPAVIPLLADPQVLRSLRDRLPFADQPLGLPQLEDDLLRRVPASLHHQSSFLAHDRGRKNSHKGRTELSASGQVPTNFVTTPNTTRRLVLDSRFRERR
jgi:hypothetical protein